MTGLRAVVVPSALALLPEYAGAQDPVPELRSACRQAVERLVARHPDELAVVSAGPRPDNVARGVTEDAGWRVAGHLLDQAGFAGRVRREPTAGLLVVANGSARRGEKAPGHLDDRSVAFDEAVGAALRAGDAAGLQRLDAGLGQELWCHDVPALQALGAAVGGAVTATMHYDDDPYGVQYWVVSWSCGS